MLMTPQSISPVHLCYNILFIITVFLGYCLCSRHSCIFTMVGVIHSCIFIMVSIGIIHSCCLPKIGVVRFFSFMQICMFIDQLLYRVIFIFHQVCPWLISIFIVFAFIFIVIIIIIITIVSVIIVVIIYVVIIVMIRMVVVVVIVVVVIVIVVVIIHSCGSEITIGQVGKVIVIVVIRRDVIGIIWVIIGRVKVDDRAAIPPCKGEVSRCIATSAKAVNMVNHILGKRQFSPTVTDQSAAHGQAHEVVTALTVASRVEGNGTSGVGVHGIVVFFMHLDITPQL